MQKRAEGKKNGIALAPASPQSPYGGSFKPWKFPLLPAA